MAQTLLTAQALPVAGAARSQVRSARSELSRALPFSSLSFSRCFASALFSSPRNDTRLTDSVPCLFCPSPGRVPCSSPPASAFRLVSPRCALVPALPWPSARPSAARGSAEGTAVSGHARGPESELPRAISQKSASDQPRPSLHCCRRTEQYEPERLHALVNFLSRLILGILERNMATVVANRASASLERSSVCSQGCHQPGLEFLSGQSHEARGCSRVP